MDEDEEYVSKERPKNPRETSNFISRLFFWYTLKTFVLGYQNKLNEANLYRTLKSDRSLRLGNRLEKHWKKELRKENPKLLKAIIKTFIWDFQWFIFVAIFLQFVRMGQPITLYYILLCFTKETTYTTKDALIFTGILTAIAFLFALTAHTYLLSLQHLGMHIRVATSALIYRKCLKLSNKSLRVCSIGQIVNLLSNDVSRFDFVMIPLPYVVIFMFDLAVNMFFMCFYMGFSSLAGTSIIICFIPIQMLMAKRFTTVRRRTATKTDERVQLMSELVSGIKVIKMYNWEEPFVKNVADIRKSEIHQILSACHIKAILMSAVLILARIALFISIVVYVFLGSVPAAPGVYLLVGLLNVMRYTQTQILPNGLFGIAEAKVSIQRLQAFLLYEEKDEETKQTLYEINDDMRIDIVNADAKWDASAADNTLTDVNLKASNELVAIIGGVGSGKTSLLNLILKEMSVTSGSVYIKGTCSYASQEPWLFDGNIRQNILFGQNFDQERYNEVIRVCSLKRDLSLLPYGDLTPIGDKGSILSGGQRARVNLARAIYREADIYLLDDPLSALDSRVGRRIFEDCIMSHLKGKCTVLVTHQIHLLQMLPKIVMLQNGYILFEGNFSVVQRQAPTFVKNLEKSVEEEETDKPVEIPTAPKMPKKRVEVQEVGSVKGRIYLAYMQAGGNCCSNVFLVFLFLITQLVVSFSDYFLTMWVNVEQERSAKEGKKENHPLSSEWFMIIFAITNAVAVLITIGRSMYFFYYCAKASTRLHDRMFKNVIRAPMQFFHDNPTGRILNRFSKDMGNIDEQFPMVTIDTIQIGLQVLGIIVLTITLNPIFTVAIAVVCIVYYLIRYFYLHTSRTIKRLEGITKSPVFTHINSTLNGLTTIRAFQAEEYMLKKYDDYQDVHTTTWQLFLSTARAFSFSLEIVCFLYITFISFGLILFKQEKFGGNIGLGITQSLTLSGMSQWGMRQWSEMENHMTSVERIYEYTHIEPEKNQLKTEEPPSNWPQDGLVEFKDVFLRYSLDGDFVLKQLSFKINPGEKVGVVGRTGAGKSSLISSIFQLSYTSGEILIDNVDIRTVRLSVLRSNISIIPQEPVLFAGTLRMNLDPFNKYNDDEIWDALEKVELKYTVMDTFGLFSPVSEGGTNFSVGQRQLLCLARAIVRHNKILVLDEATANVDPHTDFLIQDTIRNQFADCTVLTIAHRLDTIMDSDKILVMDAGQAIEFDHPSILLSNKDGVFSSLVENSGSYSKYARVLKSESLDTEVDLDEYQRNLSRVESETSRIFQ